MSVWITHWTPVSWQFTVSPSLNPSSFFKRNVIWLSFKISATIAVAPVVCPIKVSPMIKSVVLPLGPLIAEKIAVGADGSVLSYDSNIPCNSIISALFNDIKSSWTLVPYGYAPYDNPSSTVVAPMPDDWYFDLSIITVPILFFLLTLDLTLILDKVATKVAFALSVPKL